MRVWRDRRRIFCGPRGRALSRRQIFTPRTTVQRHHLVYKAPIVIDARTKPGFPDELVVRDDIAQLVDRRWSEYKINP
jgi:hypothetical protein